MPASSATRRRHGEGSIYQRSRDGKWVAVIDLGYVAGKRKRVTVTGKTHAAVLKRLRETQRSVEQGVVPDRATVEQWVTHWLDNIAAKKLRVSTLNGYRSKIALYVVPALGKVQLDKLTPDHVRSMHDAIRAKGLSETTVRQAHAILQSALHVALEDGRIIRNVAQITKAPSANKNPHPILSADQSRRVLASALDERELCRLTCALILGLRQGEALGLRWADVTFIGDQGWLVVREAVQRAKGQGLIRTEVKSAASAREVPLIPLAAAVFAAWRQTSGGQGYVFPGFKGHHMPSDPRRDWEQWKDVLDRAEAPDVPLHGARGSTATLLQQLGVPDRVIADILGHGTVRVTQAHYLHSDDAQRRSALELLGNALQLGPQA